ncbi:MAG: hypothetical protein JHC93_05780 [Parachlamydiales bacterium]|nr:hypothetical protein [Parachlamydiales bacterium]
MIKQQKYFFYIFLFFATTLFGSPKPNALLVQSENPLIEEIECQIDKLCEEVRFLRMRARIDRRHAYRMLFTNLTDYKFLIYEAERRECEADLLQEEIDDLRQQFLIN